MICQLKSGGVLVILAINLAQANKANLADEVKSLIQSQPLAETAASEVGKISYLLSSM
jgi:hypothetical protein